MKFTLIPTWLQEWEKENNCMPIYEYECPECPGCDCKFEVRQNYGDKAITRCPKCKTVAKRFISIVNHKKVI